MAENAKIAALRSASPAAAQGPSGPQALVYPWMAQHQQSPLSLTQRRGKSSEPVNPPSEVQPGESDISYIDPSQFTNIPEDGPASQLDVPPDMEMYDPAFLDYLRQQDENYLLMLREHPGSDQMVYDNLPQASTNNVLAPVSSSPDVASPMPALPQEPQPDESVSPDYEMQQMMDQEDPYWQQMYRWWYGDNLP